MLKSLVLFLVFAVSGFFSVLLFAEESEFPEGLGEAVPVMFVQNAKTVRFENGEMTLQGVNPVTIFFSDRPERLAGNVPTARFLKLWDEGKDSFRNDPPNANLSILGEKEGATNIVVEISNPRMEGDDLIYKIRILEGSPPESAGASSLFIDWWVAHGFGRRYYGPRRLYRPYPGPRVVCTRNWYTGRRWCHAVGRYY